MRLATAAIEGDGSITLRVVSSAADNALLALDRQHGRVAGTIPVGRRPLGVTLGSSGS